MKSERVGASNRNRWADHPGIRTAGYYILKLDGIWAFWIAYIFTRPLGASFGDPLSQPAEYGGYGLGTIMTSGLFLTAIIAIVVYISKTREGQVQPMIG
jgi:uncharacterized membrane-anchored protein